MGWSTSDRKDRLPSDWHAIRAECFRLNGRRCLLALPGVCTERATQVDHIRPRPDHSQDNLRPVCPECHGRKSSGEGISKRTTMRARRHRPAGRHPGFG
ncbi:HNH endonuclease signature motif containing protein [Pseudonocardia ailaonensis]|uniref:HNH endonuclease signature motif containing protein n=1 Tax=Pseudonocardia ailaonensis TaxID=367279 RepID=UPI003CD07A1F